MIKSIRKFLGLCDHEFITFQSWVTRVSSDCGSKHDEQHIIKECIHCGHLKHYKFKM